MVEGNGHRCGRSYSCRARSSEGGPSGWGVYRRSDSIHVQNHDRQGGVIRPRDYPFLAPDWSGSPPSNQSNSSDFVPPTCLDSAHLPQNVFELIQATLHKEHWHTPKKQAAALLSAPPSRPPPRPHRALPRTIASSSCNVRCLNTSRLSGTLVCRRHAHGTISDQNTRKQNAHNGVMDGSRSAVRAPRHNTHLVDLVSGRPRQVPVLAQPVPLHFHFEPALYHRVSS